MNTDDTPTPENTRPFGYWIQAVDRLLAAELATVFADEGITRRDWRLLNRIDATAPGAHPSGARAPRGPKLRTLQAQDWIERSADGWTLTNDGRLAKERLGAAIDQIRGRVTDALGPEEFAALNDGLEKVARELGWQEGRKLPRRGGGRHARHGFGPHGFGPHGFGRGFGSDRCRHPHHQDVHRHEDHGQDHSHHGRHHHAARGYNAR